MYDCPGYKSGRCFTFVVISPHSAEAADETTFGVIKCVRRAPTPVAFQLVSPYNSFAILARGMRHCSAVWTRQKIKTVLCGYVWTRKPFENVKEEFAFTSAVISRLPSERPGMGTTCFQRPSSSSSKSYNMFVMLARGMRG